MKTFNRFKFEKKIQEVKLSQNRDKMIVLKRVTPIKKNIRRTIKIFFFPFLQFQTKIKDNSGLFFSTDYYLYLFLWISSLSLIETERQKFLFFSSVCHDLVIYSCNQCEFFSLPFSLFFLLSFHFLSLRPLHWADIFSIRQKCGRVIWKKKGRKTILLFFGGAQNRVKSVPNQVKTH